MSIWSLTIIKVREKATVMQEQVGGPPDCFKLAEEHIPKFVEFDKKRKDEGTLPSKEANIFYQIDLESFGYILVGSKECSEARAKALLKEVIKAIEKSVADYEDEEIETIKAKFSKPCINILDKYKKMDEESLPSTSADKKEDQKIASTQGKVAEAQDKMRQNILTAQDNTMRLQDINDSSKRAKLLAQEMDYETDGLRKGFEWRNKKIYIIAAIVIGLILVTLILLLA